MKIIRTIWKLIIMTQIPTYTVLLCHPVRSLLFFSVSHIVNAPLVYFLHSFCFLLHALHLLLLKSLLTSPISFFQ